MKNVIPHLTTGMGLGDRFSYLHLLDELGECLEEARVRTTPGALEQRFRAMSPAPVVVEAGTHSPWVSRLPSSLGHDLIVANPRKLRAIYENDAKSDRVDAEYLARIGRHRGLTLRFAYTEASSRPLRAVRATAWLARRADPGDVVAQIAAPFSTDLIMHPPTSWATRLRMAAWRSRSVARLSRLPANSPAASAAAHAPTRARCSCLKRRRSPCTAAAPTR